MDDQNYSIEFFVSFPTIYHYAVCDDGKVQVYRLALVA